MSTYPFFMFSLQPLLEKDGLMTPAMALLILYCVTYISLNGDLNLSRNVTSRSKLTTVLVSFNYQTLTNIILMCKLQFVFSMYGCAILSFIQIFISPPTRYPHLWILVNCVFSFIHFILFFVYFNCQQIVELNEQFESVCCNISEKLFARVKSGKLK